MCKVIILVSIIMSKMVFIPRTAILLYSRVSHCTLFCVIDTYDIE